MNNWTVCIPCGVGVITHPLHTNHSLRFDGGLHLEPQSQLETVLVVPSSGASAIDPLRKWRLPGEFHGTGTGSRVRTLRS